MVITALRGALLCYKKLHTSSKRVLDYRWSLHLLRNELTMKVLVFSSIHLTIYLLFYGYGLIKASKFANCSAFQLNNLLLRLNSQNHIVFFHFPIVHIRLSFCVDKEYNLGKVTLRGWCPIYESCQIKYSCHPQVVAWNHSNQYPQP